jgi:hypothetical protein
MDNEIPEDSRQIIARERSRQEAKQTIVTSRMLVQSLVLINGGACIAVLAYYGGRNASDHGKLALPLAIMLYCLGIFTAVFAGLYVRRTSQEWSTFWELKSYPEMEKREKAIEAHRQQATRGKRWSTGLLVLSELCFLAASLCLAISIA